METGQAHLGGYLNIGIRRICEVAGGVNEGICWGMSGIFKIIVSGARRVRNYIIYDIRSTVMYVTREGGPSDTGLEGQRGICRCNDWIPFN